MAQENSYGDWQAPSGLYAYYAQPGGGGGGGNPRAGKAAAAIKPSWEESNILLHTNMVKSLQKSLGPDGKEIALRTGSKMVEFKKGKKSIKLKTTKDINFLNINENSQSTGYLWLLLKEIAQGGERIFMQFQNLFNMSETLEATVNEAKVVKTTETTRILPVAGYTLASMDLTRIIYGSLLPPNQVVGFSSIYDNFSTIEIMSKMANNETVVHELLGHFFVANRKLPYGHPDSLAGKNILDPAGQPVTGTVQDFIDMIVAEAKKNLNPGTGGAAAKPAPVSGGTVP